MMGNQNDSKMIGFQNDRNGKMTTMMINKVNTMTPRQNDLVVKNEMLWFGLHKTILFKICHKTISKKMWFIFCGLAKKHQQREASFTLHWF